MDDPRARLVHDLGYRFGDPPELPEGEVPPLWSQLAARRSHRRFSDRPVPPELIRTLAALALCSASKSDLQQRDIVILEAEQIRAVGALFPSMPWIGEAPALLVFCGDNRRQRQLHEWTGRDFANDHLDAFFNPAVDAGIALATFMVAAEARALGCCPLSVIRNHAERISELLGLPQHVFPVAGLVLGWPVGEGTISPRLPLATTVHEGRFDDDGARAAIMGYDARRAALQPHGSQRSPDRFGTAEHYGWVEDKSRQYALPERTDWGAFVRRKGFRLD